MITRGTTLVQQFALPFEPDKISELTLTYVQQGEKILVKDKNQIFVNKKTNIMKVPLSQKDTLSFHPCNGSDDPDASLVLMQIRILLSDGSAVVSNIMVERLYDILVNEAIEEEELPDDDTVIYDGGGVGGM